MRTGLSASVASHVGYVNQAFGPRLLFQNGEQGWWYDPSDFSTLFQDAAGTTPVTAVEQPCGLMLDKRLGLVLGPELVTNGGFATDSDWTKGTDWTIGSGVATKTAGTAANLTQTISSTSTRWYRCTATVTRTAGTLTVSVGTSGTTAVFNASGTYTFYILAGSSTQTLTYAADSSFAGTLDSVSVRELPGNHAYTPAAASTARPTVSARVNQLVATEDFTNVAWSKGSGVSATATTLTFTTGGSTQFVRQSVVFTSGITYKILVRVRSISGNTSLSLDLENAQSTAFTLTSALQNFEWVVLASGNRAWLDIQLGGAGSIEITAIDVRVANDGVGIPAYQRVNTATDYDSSGFPVYLRSDGSNDFMVTNSIDFTGTDKMTVCAGVRKLSDAATGLAMELSSEIGVNPGTFALFAPSVAGANSYRFISVGNGTLAPAGTGVFAAAPNTSVLTGIGNISGDISTLRRNGAAVETSTTDQGAGNFGNYPLYLFMRAGTSLPTSLRFYGSVGRGAQSNDQQIAALEGYMNTKTKAY